MNESQFGNKIRQLLNQGLVFNANTVERLRAAREQALARKKPEPVRALAFAGRGFGLLGGWTGLALRVLVPLAMVLIAATVIYTWQQNQRIAALEEIDAQLLTDDLPPDAYLDRGFQNWLKKRAVVQ